MIPVPCARHPGPEHQVTHTVACSPGVYPMPAPSTTAGRLVPIFSYESELLPNVSISTQKLYFMFFCVVDFLLTRSEFLFSCKKNISKGGFPDEELLTFFLAPLLLFLCSSASYFLTSFLLCLSNYLYLVLMTFSVLIGFDYTQLTFHAS